VLANIGKVIAATTNAAEALLIKLSMDRTKTFFLPPDDVATRALVSSGDLHFDATSP
jgi:hypothetical protein